MKILVALDESTLFAKRDEYVRNVSLIAVVVILIALLIGFRFGGSLSRRIEKTLAAVESIRDGDLNSRVESGVSEDEIGILQDGINSMAHTLQQRTEEQKKMQTALQESERYNRMLFEQSPIGLALTDMNGSLLDINSAYADIIGYSIEEAKKLTYWDITPQKYQSQEIIQLENLRTRGSYGPYEKEYIHRDGRLIAVRLSGLILERDGEQYIWSSVEDISQQKKTEESRARVMSILESTPDFVGMADRDGRVLYLNRAARRMMSVAQTGKIDHLLYTEMLCPDSAQLIVDEAIPYALEHDSWLGETEFLRPDGSKVPMLQALILHKSAEGKIEYISTIAKDISDILQTRQELMSHKEHLEELVYARTEQLEMVNRELESFSYSVSHDLRTPLRGIDGFSHALLEDYDAVLDDTGKDYLNRVRRAAQQMGGIIDTMLELSRVNRHPLQLQKVSLSKLAQDILDQLQHMNPPRKVECVITPDMDVMGDEHLLRIVLENLLGNAWKYTASSDDARIEFGCKQVQGESVYFVKDNGAGFNMKYADKLFGAFQRLHGAEFDGKGIGLATVQRCIRRLGGTVWGRGEEGKGAEFFFKLSSGSPDRA
jgi:PAS domain S-box-containing protein